MVATVTFPTWIGNNSVSCIDNFFIDNRNCYTVNSCSNGL